MQHQHILYSLMIAAFLAMLWAIREYKINATPWARPLAGFLGLVTVTSAISSIVWESVFTQHNTRDYTRKEAQYQRIAYEVLGREIVKRHPEARILAIKYREFRRDGSEGGHIGSQVSVSKREGLLRGLGTGATILVEEEIDSGADDFGLHEPYPQYRPGEEFNAAKLDALIERHRECNVVLLLTGLPGDMKKMTYWKKKKAEPDKYPILVLTNAFVYELKRTVERDYVSIILHNKPERFDINAEVPEDSEEAFRKRFLLITKENVDEISDKYPKLFSDDNEETPKEQR